MDPEAQLRSSRRLVLLAAGLVVAGVLGCVAATLLGVNMLTMLAPLGFTLLALVLLLAWGIRHAGLRRRHRSTAGGHG